MASLSILAHGVRVVESRARLPGFWNRNTVFVANLLGLFFENEEQTRMLASEVGEMDSYGGRVPDYFSPRGRALSRDGCSRVSMALFPCAVRVFSYSSAMMRW